MKKAKEKGTTEKKPKKPRKKGGFSLCFGLLCLAVVVFVVSVVVLQEKSLLPSWLSGVIPTLSALFAFRLTGPFALAPFCLFVLALGIGTFVFRKRKPFTFLLYPVCGAMYMTLAFLVGMHDGSSFPKRLYDSLMAGGVTLRSASFKVVLVFLLELILLFLLIIVSGALNRRWEKKQAFKAKLAANEAAPQEEEKPLSKREQRKLAKQRKKELKLQEKQRLEDEKEQQKLEKKQAKLQKKEKHKDKGKNKNSEDEAVAVVPTTIQHDDGGLRFPDVMDVPTLDNLKRKTPRTETKPAETTEPQEEVVLQKAIPTPKKAVEDVVSIGALDAIKAEMQRKQEKSERRQRSRGGNESQGEISGLLQGAMEAVGKYPKKQQNNDRRNSQASSEPAVGKGLLVEAVEENQKKNKDLQDMGSSFSKPVLDSEQEVLKPVEVQERAIERQPEKPVFTPKPVAQPVVEPPKPVEPVRPVEPVKPVEPPKPVFRAQPVPPVQQTPPAEEDEEADKLECQSGVGGLSSAAGGPSALINRGKLDYHFPMPSMLVDYPTTGSEIDAVTKEKGERLVQTLAEFHVSVDLINIIKGPTVTMFEILPAPGVRVNQIESLADNIQLRLPATQVRIVAPIPGKTAVGVEVPNVKRETIGFKVMVPAIDLKSYKIPMVLGKNLLGESVVIDVASTPHLLIAGATGSGKSVCVNSLICSILFRKSPKQVRLIMVDPKIVELQIYNGIPHLLTPVITDPKRTLKALDFCLYEMDRRYKLLQGLNTRNIVGYNEKVKEGNICREQLPYIVVIIDEFADLMHTVGKEMEAKVSRLTAMSRAVGIHLVLATQRPSVDVITGIIKTNIPSRIAFAVTSNTDSRIIIDSVGAEKLLGKGDMLYVSSTDPTATRIQGAFLSDNEVEQVVAYVSTQGTTDYIDESFFEDEPDTKGSDDGDGAMIGGDDGDDDALMEQALQIVVERKCASASYLQRRLKIGYNRAARLVEDMEDQGIVGPANGSKPRPLLRYPGSVSVGQGDAGNVVGDE